MLIAVNVELHNVPEVGVSLNGNYTSRGVFTIDIHILIILFVVLQLFFPIHEIIITIILIDGT